MPLQEYSGDILEDREVVEEWEETSDDFLSGTGGFCFPSVQEFFLCSKVNGSDTGGLDMFGEVRGDGG